MINFNIRFTSGSPLNGVSYISVYILKYIDLMTMNIAPIVYIFCANYSIHWKNLSKARVLEIIKDPLTLFK
jgi:hypothetical protein